MNAILCNAVDPLGHRIVLYEDRYFGHIAERHPGISVDSIQFALEDPVIITRDVYHGHRDHYYALDVEGDNPAVYLKVCVDFGSDVGRVVTAFLVNKPKPSEEVLWQRSR